MSERRRQRAARAAPAAQGVTIATALRKLVFLCWAMLLVVSVTAVGSLAAHSDNIHRLTLIDGPAFDANNQIRQAMVDAQTGLQAYQTSGDRTLLQPYFGTYSRTRSALEKLQGKLELAAAKGGNGPQNKVLGQTQRRAAEAWWVHALAMERALSRGERADLFQSRVLFERFTSASAVLSENLMAENDRTRLAARTLSSRGEALSIVATLGALLAMLLMGGRVARSISRPLTELRDTIVRQREGEPGARAREDQGSLELRSVAADFNLVTEQNLALRENQESGLRLNTLAFEIARAIRVTSDTQGALDVLCARLGDGFRADRVIAHARDTEESPRLQAQWSRPGLATVADFSDELMADLALLGDELFVTTGFRARDDFLIPEVQAHERGRAFHRATGARAVIMAPIGLGDRVVGIIYVVMVGEPRGWTASETTVVQQVGGFVARAVIEAGHQAQQREYVDRVEKLDRQKSDFLATVSHELRTPLTSISGYLEVLQDLDAGPLNAQQSRMIEVISRNAVRLRSLIEDVLVISRVEGGVAKTDLGEVSIHDLISRVGDDLSVVAQRSAIGLVIDAGPEDAIVMGDWASLDRAVVNILSNAIKFSRPGGVVSIRSTVDEDTRTVTITCQDNGVGIPAQDLADLFTRFFRASNATEQAIPGTGLGLSIAKQIVEEHHGGTLRLESVEEEGTTLFLDLPLYEPPRLEETSGNDSESGDVFGIRA